jgi:hypothetical protein
LISTGAKLPSATPAATMVRNTSLADPHDLVVVLCGQPGQFVLAHARGHVVARVPRGVSRDDGSQLGCRVGSLVDLWGLHVVQSSHVTGSDDLVKPAGDLAEALVPKVRRIVLEARVGIDVLWREASLTLAIVKPSPSARPP